MTFKVPVDGGEFEIFPASESGRVFLTVRGKLSPLEPGDARAVAAALVACAGEVDLARSADRRAGVGASRYRHSSGGG